MLGTEGVLGTAGTLGVDGVLGTAGTLGTDGTLGVGSVGNTSGMVPGGKSWSAGGRLLTGITDVIGGGSGSVGTEPTGTGIPSGNRMLRDGRVGLGLLTAGTLGETTGLTAGTGLGVTALGSAGWGRINVVATTGAGFGWGPLGRWRREMRC